MAVADGNGLPLACGIASGERHEARLVHDTLKTSFLDELPTRLIGDKAYDSDPLDEQLAATGIDMISPNRRTNVCRTQDGRKLRRYRRRWLIERLFAWLFRSRRLVTRYEHKAENFLGFVQLACIVVLVRRF